METKLKRLKDQVVVITGASSGIGLTTARMAARKGAKVVMAARNAQALREAADLLVRDGHEAVAVAADVTRDDDVRRIADTAVARFGRIDTWVNDAAVTVYGKAWDVPVEDARQLMETDFFGTVRGSRVAVEHLRDKGGALINVGSVVSDRALPLQAYYSAAKHAIKGFTDALRTEIEKEGWPIAVTLIKPGSINTPFVQHARNYLEGGAKPTYPPPVYAPDVVADAILYCATHPTREFTVGGGGRMVTAMANTPRLADHVQEAMHFRQQKGDWPEPSHENLYAPSVAGQERGPYEGMTREHSLYTAIEKHPVVSTTAVLLGAGVAIGALWAASARKG